MLNLLQTPLQSAVAQCQLLQHIAPALSAAFTGQRFYAQARKAASSRRRQSQAAAQELLQQADDGSSHSVSAVHVTEAMTAAEARSAAAATPARTSPEDLARKHGVLNETIKRLNKTLGTGTLMRLGEQAPTQLDCTSSGCLTLDVALGGGWARGRIVEVYGPESSGKTTLALHAVAEVQKAGGQAVFVDAEHAFNIHFARKLGVNVDDLIICQPSCGEDALEVVDQVLRSHAVDLVAVDSVAALLPRSELEGGIGDQQVASQARLMSYGLRKLAANASKTHTTVMFINQLRHRVGIMFGNPETTAGGQALKFYASQRVDVRAKEKVKSADGKTETGIRVKAKVVKNKVAPPYRSAEFVIAFNKGIDASGNLLEACLAVGVVQAKGSYYYYGEQRLGQGKEKVSALLATDAAMTAELNSKVRSAMHAAAVDGLTDQQDGDSSAGNPGDSGDLEELEEVADEGRLQAG